MTEQAATDFQLMKPSSIGQMKPAVLPNSPFPTRLLKLIKDEEEWLSGSELKTDNSSSSDDEMSPTSHHLNKKFNKIKKRRKSKVSFKVVDDTCSESSSTTNCCAPPIVNFSSSDHAGGGKLPVRNIIDEKHTSLLNTCIAESDEDDSEIYWRPKRGSISLTGLVSEMSATSISDTK